MTLAPAAHSGTRPSIASPVKDAVDRVSIVPITIDQYQQMIEQGIVPEDSTVELLRGVLVRKDRSSPGEDPMGHGPLHCLIVDLLTFLSNRLNSGSQYIRIQLPIAFPPDGAPEPDAAIIRGTPRDYKTKLPGPGDVWCVIEVAHSSIGRDREDKLQIYAAAGVPQYVIINLNNDTIESHTSPDPAAELYKTKSTIERGQVLQLLTPDGSFDVRAEELLP
jgi:Uma2 family endonuclease